MSSEWISKSLEEGRIVSEEMFEVSRHSKATRDFAPRRARLHAASKSSTSSNSSSFSAPNLISSVEVGST